VRVLVGLIEDTTPVAEGVGEKLLSEEATGLPVPLSSKLPSP
jgi:hypothetical protein